MDLDSSPFESLGQEKLDLIMRTQAERLAYMLSPCANDEAAQAYAGDFAASLKLEVVESEAARVPLHIGDRTDGQRTVFFDNATFGSLCSDLIDHYSVTEEDVAVLYLGSGIVAKLLEDRIDPENMKQVERLWDTVKNPISIDVAVQTTNLLDEHGRYVVLNTLMHLGEEEYIAKLNILRFAFGVLFMESETTLLQKSQDDVEVSYESRITQNFLEGLKLSIRTKDMFVSIMKSLGNDELTVDRVLADKISEVELAACFPMRMDELRRLLSVCDFSDS